MSVASPGLRSGIRWHVGCDACGAGGWIGPRAGARAGAAGWCETCQRVTSFAARARATCDACGGPLSVESLRSEEIYGEIQHLVAVLEAWRGRPAMLAELLPDRPRFLTDLTPPPARPGDDRASAAALDALAAGAFADARSRLEELLAAPAAAEQSHRAGSARRWSAVAIAAERLGDPGRAEAAWTRALRIGESVRARLARGALRARRGDYPGARSDLARAGGEFEARWNRAALAVVEAVAATGGMPAAEVLARARAEAGEVSPYWSSPTIGRLLWTLLAERVAGPGALPDAAAFRAAERELEHDTFWDRALVVHGYAVAGLAADVARTAAALAGEGIERLLEEPCLRARRALPIAEAIRAARAAVASGVPGAAHAALEPLLSRPDLARYRLPCEHCGRGTVGIDQVEE